MTLIDLCKTHPLVAEYFYALEMTKGAHRKFNNAKDIEGKDRASKERQEAINKKIAKFRKWVTKDSHTKH
jgi:hypothetical protein